jgi:hypothetical protein
VAAFVVNPMRFALLTASYGSAARRSGAECGKAKAHRIDRGRVTAFVVNLMRFALLTASIATPAFRARWRCGSLRSPHPTDLRRMR